MSHDACVVSRPPYDRRPAAVDRGERERFRAGANRGHRFGDHYFDLVTRNGRATYARGPCDRRGVPCRSG